MKKNILLKNSLYKQISRFSVAGLSAVAVDFERPSSLASEESSGQLSGSNMPKPCPSFP